MQNPKMAKKLKVEIEWKYLERIAEFYKFPVAVFCGNLKIFKNSPRTRDERFTKRLEAYDKIKEIIEETR